MTLKCDYEKAWRELEKEFGDEVVYSKDKRVGNTAGQLRAYMKGIEGRHRNVIDIRRRSNEEVAGLFMRKFMNLFAKYINLKNKLEKLDQESMDEKIEISYFRHELNQIYQSVKKDIEECK